MLGGAVTLGDYLRCHGEGFCWCDSFFTPVIVLVYIDEFVVVGDRIPVRFGHKSGIIL